MSETNVSKILVVDDEAELKNALVEALGAQSFEVRGFTNGTQALSALQQEAFDIVLSDLMMPEMDGITLVEKALEIDPHLVAIIMTGQGTIQTAVDAMKVGAFDYVLKPFRLATLLPTLTRAINSRRLRLENLQLRETVAIYELCQTIALTLDEQTLISKLADAALQQTEADEVSILLPTNTGEELYVAAVRGESRQRLLGEHVPLEETISGWVVREREPLLLTGEVKDVRFHPFWPHPEIKSAISIPMQVGNKLIGTININAIDRPRPFTLGQMKALTILASTAAAALESASLYKQLRTAEANYRSIFENAAEGIFQSTADRRFITVNPSLARILGYGSPEEVITAFSDIGKQLYVRPEQAREVTRALEAAGAVQGFEFEGYRKEGERIWLSLNLRLVRDEAGRMIYREGTIEDITERKRAEAEREQLAAEIESQRQRLNSIVATVPGVVWEGWGQPDTSAQRINFVSEYVETMLGYTVNEWLSTPNFWLTIVHPDDREEAGRVAGECFKSGQGTTQQFRWVAKDGHALWVEANYVVVKDEAGRPLGLRGVTTDISERKRAADQLLESERRFRQLAENINEVFWVVDPIKREMLYVSPAYEQIWGRTCESLKQQPDSYIAAVHPEDRERIVAAAEHQRQGHPADDEYRILQPDTSVRWIHDRAFPIKDDQGRVIRIVGIAEDITERKRAGEALRESEERYRDLVENAHDIIYSHDLEGTYTSVNKAGELITGYSREEALRLDIAKTVAPEHLANAKDMLRRKLAGERVTAYEMELIRKDGRRVAVEVNTKLVFQNGVAVGVQGIARDVTERKELEEQLRQSQKMEAIGQLAGGVAHDFNNLLTAINGYTSLALQRIDEKNSIKPYLEEVKKAGERAANLTRQLLAFGRKQILQPIPLDLNSIVADMNKMLRRLIGEDINLTAKLAADLKRIKADPGQIEQVLVNLVVNARDAMPHGGSLTIETANVELDHKYVRSHVGTQAGNYVMLAVSDTGSGMSEETRARIFEPFFTTKEKGKGTGLGLSTVYGIVQQSGGSIWVYSELNRGTAFKVYLPQLETGPTPHEEKARVENAPRGSETILLVEDEEVVRGLATHILEDSGYKVIKAKGGEEAIQLCTQHTEPIDLLLTDVVMPEASGKEVAERVTTLMPRLKVLFMSGYTDEAIVHLGVLDSDVEFIQKPFTPLGLSKKVREVLDSNGAHTSSRKDYVKE